jgi:hypothetical protein
MTYDKLHTIRSFFRRLRDAEFSTPGRKSALLVLSAALLSSIASGQIPTIPTTTALPYVLTDQPGEIHVTPIYGVAPVPAAVSAGGGFSSLLGGGFGSLLTTPTASTASAAATAAVRSLLMLKKANTLQADLARMNQTAELARQNIVSENPELFCEGDAFTAVKYNHQLKTSVKARSKGDARPADSPACTLPEEQQAEEAEEELQAVTESEDATQEAIEAAEEAAEAAEAAAEAAETAAEIALDSIDVLEGILDALALF